MSELTTAARPYARAVFEMAREGESFDTWSESLQYLATIVSDSTMTQLLEAPKLTHQQRATMVEQVAGDKLDDQCSNFVKLLAENGRLELLGDIKALYEEYRADAEGAIEASVVSARKLTQQQTKNIAAALSKRLQRQVNIVSSIDKSLIAGAVIRAGDLVIDGSLKGRLQNMAQHITE